MKKTFALLALVALSLSACSNSVKQELGVGRKSQDEFAVVKRAPLSMPPDYALRPPGTPADETVPTQQTPTETAKEALLGKSSKEADKNNADDKMLEKLGAENASPDIRKQIDEDNGYLSLKHRSVADKLIHWDDEPSLENVPASVVNAKKEAERLKQNRDAGKPINEGNVPVIEKKSSTIDKIF